MSLEKENKMNIKPNEIDAHNQGYQNFKEGKEGPNPYHEDTKNWQAWESGWGRAKEEKNDI